MDVSNAKLYLDACRQLHGAIERIDRTIAGFLGLPLSDLRCLHLIAETSATASAIGQALGLTAGSVTALIDRLEAAGLAERIASTEDRRSVHVALKRRGRTRLSRLETVAGPPLLEALSRHSEREVERCRTLMSEIAVAIDAAARALDADDGALR